MTLTSRASRYSGSLPLLETEDEDVSKVYRRRH
jgi:hypothetical protein